MKFLPFMALVVTFAASALAQGSLQSILSDAQTAYIRGDLPAAKRGFQTVLQADPRNPVAANYLRMIQVQEAKAPKVAGPDAGLQNLILPKVEFREASLSSALEFLRQTVEKVSGGKQKVNFVLQLPPSVADSTQVTISLRDIPFTEAVKYIGSLASVDFVYDKYAIIVKPKDSASAQPTQGTAQ